MHPWWAGDSVSYCPASLHSTAFKTSPISKQEHQGGRAHSCADILLSLRKTKQTSKSIPLFIHSGNICQVPAEAGYGVMVAAGIQGKLNMSVS